MKPLICEFKHYEIRGKFVALDWNGNIIVGRMETRTVDSLEEEVLKNNINDNGFGVQRFIAVSFDVYKCYEYGAKIYLCTDYIDLLNMCQERKEKYFGMLYDTDWI